MSVTQISVPPSNATRLCTKIWWGAKKRNHKPRKNWEAVDFQKIQAMSIAINQHTNLEIGNHISWQTVRDWHPFQWNCSLMSGEPVLPKHHWSQQMSLMVTEHMQSNRIEETEKTYRIELNWDHLVNFILCYDTCLDQLLQFLPWNIPILLPLTISRKHQAGPLISISMDINPYPYPYKDDNDTLQQMIAANNTKFLAGSVWGRSNWIY